MLNLIVGRAGSGKTETVMSLVEKNAALKKECIVVVPEQASFFFERDLALRLSDELAPLAKIKNFKRLCRDIFNDQGRGARKMINDPLRAALVRRAMLSLKDEITYYRRHKNDAAFYSLVADVINELKNGGVKPEGLALAAAGAKSPLSAAKLNELSLIYAAYESLIANHFQDGADELCLAAALCEKTSIFDGKIVFFDGFTGFTEPEYQMLSAIMEKASEVFCTVCCFDIFLNEDDSFSFVRKNARRLISLAKNRGVEVKISHSLSNPYRFKAAGLRAAEGFFGNDKLVSPSIDGVHKIIGKNPYDEAERVADEIVALVRDEGYDYFDIAVVSRDVERYKFAVERTFSLYSIPLFSDATGNLLDSPVTRFFLCTLSLSSGITTEKLIDLLKTSLFDIAVGDIDELANYAFVWGIDGGAWYAAFTKNPDGLDSRPDAERLMRVENARKKAVQLIGGFIDNAKNAVGRKLVAAAYELFENSGALKKLENASADERSLASSSLRLLDELYDIIEDEPLSANELAEQLSLLAAATPNGDIPPSLCEVSFGSANRMRTQNPRAVFVIGLNDGVFPKTSFDAPLLSFSERELLSDGGANLARDFESSAMMEEHFLYRAVTAARERLYLCCSDFDQKGSSLMPTAKLASFIKSNGTSQTLTENSPARFVVNKKTALRAYAEAKARGDNRFAATIKASSAAAASLSVDFAAREASFSITDRNIIGNYLGDKTLLSASRIEAYEQCPFSYFLNYIMKIKPLKQAEISPLEAGTFVHAVLERVMRSLDGNLMSLEEAKLGALAENTADEVVREQIGDLVDTNSRLRYLFERLKAQSSRLLLRLRSEQSQSEFRPCDYELKISDEGDVKPLSYLTPDGKSVSIVGAIDRVDLLNKNGRSYVRVVDYKTGDKAFSLSDVFYGLNIQMLLYLFTLCDKKNDRYENAVPAAVMYMPADPKAPAVDEQSPSIAVKKAYRMDGLVIDDAEVVAAMERTGEGVFIPVAVDKNGELKKSDKLASLEKLGRIKSHIDGLIIDMASALYDGKIDACPIVKSDGGSACDYCDYKAVCRRDRNNRERTLSKLDPSALFTDDEAKEADVL